MLYNKSFKNIKAGLSLRQKVGQLFMPAAFINDSEEEIQSLEALIRDHHIGGLCFFHSRASAATNFEGKKEVKYNAESLAALKHLIERYQKAAKIPLLISIDAEWGLAMRVENTPQFPYALTLGFIEEGNELISAVGECIGRDCREAGIHWNFAPVADINNNPLNPVIGYRSFGEDPQMVAKKSIAMMKGMQRQGILVSAKHFPGHGDTATDSHLGLPLIDKTRQQLWEHELYPFRRLIDAGVDSVMVGHLSLPKLTAQDSLPASLSPELIKNLLRGDMEFGGVVVSDALNMHSVSRMFTEKGKLEYLAFEAGNDVLCFAEHIAAGISTIINRSPEENIESAFERVWNLKQKAYEAAAATWPEPPLETSALNRQLAEKSLCLYKGDAQKLEHFRKSEFSTFNVGKVNLPDFLGKILNKKSPVFSGEKGLEEAASVIKKGSKLLLAVTPPSIKPPGKFGFEEKTLSMLHKLMAEHEVVLYLFGNPYALNQIPFEAAQVVVLVHQELPEFQLVAASHFLGETRAEGKMPVRLK